MDTPEQIAAELAASQVVVKEDEVRAAVIAEYGFDEVDDAERIDKLVAREVESQKKLSAAIGQKIKHRNEVEALKNDPRLKVAPTPPENKVVPPEDIARTVNDTVSKTLEQRDLDAMEYPDDIKKEIQRVAQITGKTVKQAAKDPYIVSTFIEQWQKDQDSEAASISRTNRSAGKGFSMDNPPDVDMSTKEGREKWDAWKADMIKKGN